MYHVMRCSMILLDSKCCKKDVKVYVDVNKKLNLILKLLGIKEWDVFCVN